MHRLIAGLLLVATLVGCATPTAVPVHATGPLPSPYGVTKTTPTCLVVSRHVKEDDEVVPTAYRCLNPKAIESVPVGICSSELGYYLKDGTYVPSHQRCELYGFRSYLAESAKSTYDSASGDSSSAPCVTSACGPVSVKGYTRKDGTYVRPHTRSRARR
jgi:hypothetical protein